MSTTVSLASDRAQYFRKVSALYTENGWDRLKRHWQYIRTPHREATTASGVALVFIVGGALLGAKTGKKIGNEIGKLVTNNPQKAQFGGDIGTGVGFFVGAGAGGYLYMTTIERSQYFEKWRVARLDDKIKEAITYSYSDDEILTNFTCPVSLCVMDIPARTPSGGVFDYSYLMNCPRESNGNIIDPLRNPSYPEQNVLPDFEMSIVIQKRALFLMKTDIEHLGNAPLLKQALMNQLKEIEQNRANRYENAREFIEERRRNKVVSPMEYKAEIAEFEHLFGENPEQDLDWSIDWAEILKSRWEKLHPKS